MRKYYLGIDIGSVFVALVFLDENKCIVHKDYAFHGGKVAITLAGMLHEKYLHYFNRFTGLVNTLEEGK
jgi:activator of 2-hydroxyglutaryl-CoA dehydratase